MHTNSTFGPTATLKSVLPNGSIHVKNKEALAEYPERITDKLSYWADKQADKTFLARRDMQGNWQELSYGTTLQQVESIAQALLNIGFAEGESIAILSENSLEHALLSLAALHIGIPYTPISSPYSLVSDDFGKLKHCLDLMTPKVIFAQDARQYAKALTFTKSLYPEAIIITVEGTFDHSFDALLAAEPTDEVTLAHQAVTGETIAKILFTSGSTGLPKGVINTHRMWCVNLQQITQAFPFMASTPPVFVDWLPWNHTFGGNHNIGLVLYNGGTFYIDDGKPTSKGIEVTVQNLREISPTAYFNVPKGFEMLVSYLEKEPVLRETFFKNLTMFFYAGASLAQPIWNRLEELAMETIGRNVPIITGLGCTESGPSALFANWEGSFSGLLGVPVAGMDVKLVPDGDKLEIRYKAPNVTKGYWRNEEATQKAFDEEGYYRTGDAVRFLDEENPDKGLVFDGRIAEDFKLSTGTWVNVGILKAKVLAAGSPIVQDVVIAGLDREYIGAILFLNPEACKKKANLSPETNNEEAFLHESIQEFVEQLLKTLGESATGSATRIAKAVVAIEPPSIDLGEITDKGSLNQRAVLKHRATLVEQLYA